MTKAEDQANQHWIAVWMDILKQLSTNGIAWALGALLIGWFGHASFNLNPASGQLQQQLEQIKDQTLLINVKLGAMIEAMPADQRDRTMSLIKDRVQILALAGKPTTP
jgi:hypothetical protein